MVVLPSGFTSTVASIDSYDGSISEAFGPMSVTMRLTSDVDISRGDMICRPNNQPSVSQDLQAMVCWMSESIELVPRMKLALKHTTRSSRVMASEIQYRIDVNTLHRDEKPESLKLNEIGRVSLRSTQPLFFDEYRRNRNTGSFILMDEATNVTVAAGIIVGSG